MNKYIKVEKKAFFLFSVVILFSFFFHLSFAKTITLGTTQWAPYVQNDEHKGYAYEIVVAAFKEAGYDNVKIVFMPWADAAEAVNTGQLDGIFPEYFSSERKQFIFYTDSFSESPVGFYKKNHSGVHFPNTEPTKNLMDTFDAMKHYRFGVVKDYVNLASFDNDQKLHKVFVNSDLDNLKQLYMGKVDLIIIDQHVAEYLLHYQLPPEYHEQLLFMDPPLIYKKLYVGISKKAEDADKIVENFNKGLDAIKENGLFNEIIQRDAELTEEHIA